MIKYLQSKSISAEEVCRLFSASGIRRPVDDVNRIQRMIDHADIILTAWDDEKLVGIARSITDYSYCCYLSDLAVDKSYQNQGIGKNLIEQLKNIIGEEVSLLLVSAPEAMEYYPKIGFNHTDKAFLIPRKK